ncbi:MAG: MBL fold metallo-hydrolase, partial [Alphaproteobacteria bacterium]|nr:MBL fold metallo-hydrolase [Alphaproteobacteria bacterium]
MDRDVPRRIVSAALAIALLLCGAYAQPLVKPWQAKWDEGSPNCAAHHRPPLEVHEFNPRTFVLRENLCATWEANFIYLLIGSRRALLIDTGDVADSKKMPLARSVMWLLSRYGAAGLPLLVVHTHRHLDHRAGDPQFEHLRNVQVVGYDLVSVKQYYGFADWPEGHAHIDLGNRIIDVLPAPGHEATHIV